MGNTLTTAEKAELLVTQAGASVYPATVVDSPTGIVAFAVVTDTAGVNHFYVEGVAVGTTTLTATYGGSTGTLDVTVTEAPLTLTLGTPEPK